METADVTVTARVPRPLRTEILTMAHREDRTISGVVRLLLEEAVEARRQKLASAHRRESR